MAHERNPSEKKWYDYKGVVILLLIVFFPIGLYALWKNPSFSVKWKIGLSFLIGILVIIAGISDENNNVENKESDTKKEVASKKDSVQKEKSAKEEKDSNSNEKKTFQEHFLSKKINLFVNNYLKAKNEAQKRLFSSKTEKLTENLLDSIDYQLNDWVGRIKRINLALGYERDEKYHKTMTPNEIREKYPEGRDVNIEVEILNKNIEGLSFEAKAYKEFNPKKGKRGIKPSSPLHEKVLNLEKGQKITFSGKVTKTLEGKNKHGSWVWLNVNFNKIEPIQ